MSDSLVMRELMLAVEGTRCMARRCGLQWGPGLGIKKERKCWWLTTRPFDSIDKWKSIYVGNDNPSRIQNAIPVLPVVPSMAVRGLFMLLKCKIGKVVVTS